MQGDINPALADRPWEISKTLVSVGIFRRTGYIRQDGRSQQDDTVEIAI